MASIIDRLLGRPDRTPEAKAVTGPGAFAMTYHQPWSGSAWNTLGHGQPNRLMAEAQQLYRAHPWVYRAESIIVESCLSLPWHLEDEDGETVDVKSDSRYRDIVRLIERPNERMTRRELWGVTLRHDGLAGNGTWVLDQRDALRGTPLSLLYLNPVRLTPSVNAAGYVAGWVLDHPENPMTGDPNGRGVPLSADEVVHFKLHEPDFGVWGSGWVEAAQRKIDLSRITDGYIGQVLGTGGRITGVLAPKDDRTSFTDDEFKQFANDWRRIVDDPQAAKRLQISKKPVELVQTSMSPRDLLLPDVSKLSRDDVMAAAGVPLSQAGIPTPSGLNSGERGKYDEAALYQGAVIPRMEGFRETFQYGVLDRFELGLQLVIDYPEFDDEKPIWEMLDLAKVVPLTNDERRARAGLDPLEDEELGKQIFIASTMTRLDEEPEPEPTLPAQMPPPSTGAATPEEVAVVEEGKANVTERLRARMEAIFEPRLREIVSKVLTEQRAFVASKVEHAVRKRDFGWWNPQREDRRFRDALEPELAALVANVARETGKLVERPAKASVSDAILDALRDSIGQRISGINQTTLEQVRSLISAGIAEGESPTDIADRLEGTFGPSRAELISRTETMLAYNEAALRSYGAYDVAQVQAIDGDKDDECAARDGNTYAVDDALNITDHPNGTLDWIPVV